MQPRGTAAPGGDADTRGVMFPRVGVRQRRCQTDTHTAPAPLAGRKPPRYRRARARQPLPRRGRYSPNRSGLRLRVRTAWALPGTSSTRCVWPTCGESSGQRPALGGPGPGPRSRPCLDALEAREGAGGRRRRRRGGGGRPAGLAGAEVHEEQQPQDVEDVEVREDHEDEEVGPGAHGPRAAPRRAGQRGPLGPRLRRRHRPGPAGPASPRQRPGGAASPRGGDSGAGTATRAPPAPPRATDKNSRDTAEVRKSQFISNKPRAHLWQPSPGRFPPPLPLSGACEEKRGVGAVLCPPTHLSAVPLPQPDRGRERNSQNKCLI